MDNKIFRVHRSCAYTDTVARHRVFHSRFTAEARHSINSGLLLATDHLFATCVIKVNESSTTRVGYLADGAKSRKGDARCFLREIAIVNEPGIPSININVLINIMRRFYCTVFIVAA